ALAFPLLAVGSAQAAIAGANPEQTLSRPDLLSATALTNNNVDFCFDKVLNNSGLVGGNFTLSGYRSGRTVAATTALIEQTVDTTGKCVRATFPAAIGDIGNYTVAGVAGLAVQTPALIANLTPDNTPLTVPSSLAPTHNGTTGFTVGPDLVGVLPDPTTNTIIYTFDQAVVAAPAAANFSFVLPSGTTCFAGGTALISGNQVAVGFAPAALCPVGNAVRADILPGAAFAAADPAIPSPPEAAIVPGSNGVTSAPDLTGAVLESGGTAILFTFDKNVSVTTPTGFNAIFSDGTVAPSTSATVVAASTTSTTIRAVFQNPGGISLSVVNEYVVWGSANAGAVTNASAPLLPNAPDAKPAGDNAGAFARGFTTGPDAFAATISKGSGLLTIALDQRVFFATAAGIVALDNTGSAIATAPAGSVSIPTQPAGPELITVQFSPGTVTTMANLFLAAGALITQLPQSSVNQDLSVTSTASLLRAARSTHHPMSKHRLAAIRARTRAQERALRAHLLRHLRHSHR
ncbi:MAG TPA: hypothetical protein VGX45_15655, partial [Solirubrobacteraceae bacterium]|nr:hypothetical protein [Solirubrobacteraceae bacterium]